MNFFNRILVIMVVFIGVGVLTVNAQIVPACSVAENPNGIDQMPVLVIHNEVAGGEATDKDFSYTVTTVSPEGIPNPVSYPVSDGELRVNLENLGYLGVNTSLPGYDVLKPNFPNVEMGRVITCTLVSTFQKLVSEDKELPVITLNGDAVINLEVGGTYNELGATVTDNVDTDLVATIDPSDVDMNNPGSYLVTYNAIDNSGNIATEVTRTVNVAIASSTNEPSIKTPAPTGTGSGSSVSGSRIRSTGHQNGGGQVLGASEINWSALTDAERADLLAPIFQQLKEFLRLFGVYLAQR